MNKIFPNKLKPGDTIMVVAPSDSLFNLSRTARETAKNRFQELGLNIVFGKNTEEIDEFDSSSVTSRVSDIHDAFSNKEVSGVITAFGGYNSNQLLKHLDWNLIKNNPKVFLGFSDTTALQNAVYAKTGLVTYSGPSFARFAQERHLEYTLDYFYKCLFENNLITIESSKTWSDDWWLKDQSKRTIMPNEGSVVINNGLASGTILGANLSTFNLLQGTEFFPDISGSVLFLEDDEESEIGHFDRDLQSLIHLPNFSEVKGLVIGRFQNASKVTKEKLIKIIKNKPELDNIPVIANMDFGHTDPIFTFPIGGEVTIKAEGGSSEVTITKH